jgi:hypothetical protein
MDACPHFETPVHEIVATAGIHTIEDNTGNLTVDEAWDTPRCNKFPYGADDPEVHIHVDHIVAHCRGCYGDCVWYKNEGEIESPGELYLQAALKELGITLLKLECPVSGLVNGEVMTFSIGDVVGDCYKVVGFHEGGGAKAVVLFDESKKGVDAVKMLPYSD